MPTAFHLRQPAHQLRAAARRGTSSPRARPGVVTDMPTPLPTPVVAVGTACRHRERRKSREISITYVRASRQITAATGVMLFCLCVVISRKVRGSRWEERFDLRSMVPRAPRPKGRRALVRVRRDDEPRTVVGIQSGGNACERLALALRQAAGGLIRPSRSRNRSRRRSR